MKVTMAGPIEWWWDDRWNTFDHWWYAAWRDVLQDVLVANGHLTYRPDLAIKGAWDDDFQEINDKAIEKSDLVLDMRPKWIEGITCNGTDKEIGSCVELGKPWTPAGPPTVADALDHYRADGRLREQIERLKRSPGPGTQHAAYIEAMLWPFAEAVVDRISAWWEGGEPLEPSSERC